MNDELDERLERLETKLAFAEDLLETLNLTVFRQQEQIDALQRALQRMTQQLSDLREAGSASGDPRFEIPPHY